MTPSSNLNKISEVDAVSSFFITRVSFNSRTTSLALSDTYGDSCEDVSRFPRLERVDSLELTLFVTSDAAFSKDFEATSVELDEFSSLWVDSTICSITVSSWDLVSNGLLTSLTTVKLSSFCLIETSETILLVVELDTVSDGLTIPMSFPFVFIVFSSANTLGERKANPTRADANPTPLNFLKE